MIAYGQEWRGCWLQSGTGEHSGVGEIFYILIVVVTQVGTCLKTYSTIKMGTFHCMHIVMQ